MPPGQSVPHDLREKFIKGDALVDTITISKEPVEMYFHSEKACDVESGFQTNRLSLRIHRAGMDYR